MNSQGISVPGFALRIEASPDAASVHCAGKLTAEHVASLRREVKSLLPGTKRIVLDLTRLTYLDSSGLGAVVGLYLSARSAGCELQLINLSKQVRQLLGMTNLLVVFEHVGKYPTRMP